MGTLAWNTTRHLEAWCVTLTTCASPASCQVMRMFVGVTEGCSASSILSREECCVALVSSMGLDNHVRREVGPNQCNVQKSFAASTRMPSMLCYCLTNAVLQCLIYHVCRCLHSPSNCVAGMASWASALCATRSTRGCLLQI